MPSTTTSPPTRLMTNQIHRMTESSEQEPTRSCTALKKAHKEECVLVAVAHVLVETVNSVMPSIMLVKRWATLRKVRQAGAVNVVEEFPAVFKSELGCYKGPPVSFTLNPVVLPIRLKPQLVSFTIQPRIIKEIDKLLDNLTDFLLHQNSMPHSA
ncbi:UNVERIFIED_CONTAM: hypothetical protein K2H54_034217 [Gekko kuhli]